MTATDIAIDRGYENAAAAEWERQNAPEPRRDRLRMVAGLMKLTILNLDQALGAVGEAADLLEGTPDGDKIASYLDEMENAFVDLKIIQADLERRGS